MRSGIAEVEDSSEEEKRYLDSNSGNNNPFSTSSRGGATQIEGGSTQSHGIPIVQMVQSRDSANRYNHSESSSQLEEGKYNFPGSGDNLRLRLI